MVRILFDYGHGGNDPGAIRKKRKESDDVLKLGKSIAKILRKNGIIVDETRTSDVKVSLEQRSNMYHKKSYHYFISFHRNASTNPEATGAETYLYRPAISIHTKTLAYKLQTAMVEIGFKNRGIKKADFHVLRETLGKGILLEVGFITNKKDNQLFDKKFNDLVNSMATAILDHVKNTHQPLKKTNNVKI